MTVSQVKIPFIIVVLVWITKEFEILNLKLKIDFFIKRIIEKNPLWNFKKMDHLKPESNLVRIKVSHYIINEIRRLQ